MQEWFYVFGVFYQLGIPYVYCCTRRACGAQLLADLSMQSTSCTILSNSHIRCIRKTCVGMKGHRLLACLLACLSACLLVCLLACLFACLLGCLLVCLFACLLACLPACADTAAVASWAME